MKQFIQIECPYCESQDVVKNGKSENGTQRYRGNTCLRSFQWEYRYDAWIPGVKAQITIQTLNGSGVSDISRNIEIAKDTVIAELKKKEPAEVNVAYAEHLKKQAASGINVEMCLETEADEFWSYVGDQSTQRWTGYALDRANGTILAHQNGRRTDEMCEQLLAKLDAFPIATYYTDNWQSYAKFIPSEQHWIGKKDTWKIERTNLNFRTQLKRLQRKTMCCSKNEAIHDKVIGLYIENTIIIRRRAMPRQLDQRI